MRALKIAGLAINGLRRSPLRMTLTTLGVTFATGALVTMIGLALGVQRQAETPFRALGLLNNIQVKPAERSAGKKPPVLNDAALEKFEKLPGVTTVYPDSHVKNITIRSGDKETTAIGLAMPREAALVGMADEILIAGRFFDESNQPEAILGAQPAKNLGFNTPQEAIGKQVTVEAAGQSPEGGSDHKLLTVTIVGIYSAPPLMPPSAQQGILLPVELMKEIPGVYLESALASGYASVTVRVRDPALLDGVQKEIDGMGYRARTILSKLQDMRRFFLAIQLLLTAVGGIALAIAALGIVNTLLMAVLERYQEIGLCKAIGASDGDLFVLFLTEAGIIGLLGGLTGIGLGWLMSWGMEALASVYAHRHDIAGRLDLFAFPLGLLAVSLAFSVLVSVVAGIYPALRAARVDPIRALRSH
jgi:putative ABC transport system permease protein